MLTRHNTGFEEICLIIIYNNNFEKNIDKIEKIYSNRFSNIYHLMPFYRGDRKNVIPVYENSYQFNGYITQGAHIYIDKKYSHYVFIADDMIINPLIHERNILEWFRLDENSAFVSNLMIMQELGDEGKKRNKRSYMNSPHAKKTVFAHYASKNSCEWQDFLPPIDEARKKFSMHGVDWRRGVTTKLFNLTRRFIHFDYKNIHKYKFIRYFLKLFTLFINFNVGKNDLDIHTDKLLYPMCWSFSDLVIVPQSSICDFCHYCGIYAAMQIFVEYAIPTALIFSCDKIITLKDIPYTAVNGIDDYSVREKFEKDFGCSFDKLIKSYPKDCLYIHPIKLSRWSNII